MRILVVDDNVDGCESLGMLFRLWGYECSMAHDGVSALELARTFRPDVVISDIGLPRGMDGHELARRLRADSCRDSLLIALSGRHYDSDRRESLAAGFDHHLVKPAEPLNLQALFAAHAEVIRGTNAR